MGTTAEKLTYLNDTKEDLKEIINYTGANIGTNDTFRSYVSKLKQGYLDILNNGIDTLYNNFPKVSGIGSNLSLTPTYKAPIKLNEIQGDTLQDGTPTPSSPVPIQSVTGLQNVEVCGKNLFDKNNIIEGKYIDGNGNVQTDANSFIGDYIRIDNTKPYYISSSLVNAKRIVYYNASKTFISREVLTTAGSSLTIPNNTYYVIISGYISDLDTLQLEQNTTKTNYEPYKGNTYEVNLGDIELNKIGTYEDSIKKSTGKNLVYEIEQGSFNYQTGAFNTNANIIRTKKIPVKPNTTYTISSKLALGECCTYFYENDGTTGIAGSLLASTTTVKNISFTTPNNAYYMIFRLGASSVPYTYTDDNNIMLNEGSTALPYEPYGKVWYEKSNNQTLKLNSTDYTWYRNTITIDGTTYSQYYTNISDKPFANANVKCNYFTNTSENVTNKFYYGVGGKNIVFVAPSVNGEYITSVADWKTWIDSINMEVIGPIDTPKYTVITNTELINQLESFNNAKSKNGTTNINVDGSLPVILGVKALKGE